MDDRWRHDSVARCRAVRCRWCIADLASLCAAPPIQWTGRDPTRAYPRNQRYLRSYPPPQLSWPAYQLIGMEPGFSFGNRLAPHSIAYSALVSAYSCRRKPAAIGVLSRVQRVPLPYIASNSRDVLADSARQGLAN